MNGFALEVKMIRWTCKCKSHVNGACKDPSSHKSETVTEAYLGTFGENIKTRKQAWEKWGRLMSSNDLRTK